MNKDHRRSSLAAASGAAAMLVVLASLGAAGWEPFHIDADGNVSIGYLKAKSLTVETNATVLGKTTLEGLEAKTVKVTGKTTLEGLEAKTVKVTGKANLESVEASGMVKARTLFSERELIAGYSELNFAKTDLKYTGQPTSTGHASIQNATDYNSLMILGRSTTTGRMIGMWDHVTVFGNLSVAGLLKPNVLPGPYAPGTDYRAEAYSVASCAGYRGAIAVLNLTGEGDALCFCGTVKDIAGERWQCFNP